MAKKSVELGSSLVNLRTRFRVGITWNLLGTIFNQGSTFAVNILVANILGQEVFGEYAVIQSTLATLSVIAQLATGYTATKYTAEFRSSDKEKTGRILGLCSAISTTTACLASLTLLISAPWLAMHMLQAPHLALGLRIAAGVVLFTVINGYQMGTLAGLESYHALAKAGTISGCLYLALCSSTAWLWGLHGILGGLVLTALLQWVVLRRLLYREIALQGITIRYRGLGQENGIFYRFALPAAISGFSSMPALWLANTFLVRQPDGYSQMALYSAANNLRVLVLFLPNIMNNVGMSLLNNQKGLQDERRYRKVFWVNVAMSTTTVLVGAMTIALLGPIALKIFGKNFDEGYPVLLILMLATVLEAIAAAIYQVIQSQERIWLSFFAIALPRDGAIALLAYFLSPLYGAVGLAWSYTVAWTLALLIMIFLVKDIWKMSIGININQ